MLSLQRLAIYALVVLSIFMSGYGIAWKKGADKLTAFTAEQAALAKAQDQINQEKARRDEKAAADIKSNYNRNVADLRSYYERMRDSSTSTNGMPAKSESSSRTYATAADLIANPTELAEQCAVTTLMLVNLQEFERRVSE